MLAAFIGLSPAVVTDPAMEAGVAARAGGAGLEGRHWGEGLRFPQPPDVLPVGGGAAAALAGQ